MNNLEKRLQLLKKSYERVPSKFQTNAVLQTISAQQHPNKKTCFPFRISVIGIASLFLIFMMSLSFFSKQSEVVQSTETIQQLQRYVESSLHPYYLKQREQRQEVLQLSDTLFAKYANFADQSAAVLRDPSTFNYVQAEDQLRQMNERAIEALYLPNEIVQKLRHQPLTDNIEDSVAQLAVYREKTQLLSELYEESLLEASPSPALLQAMENQSLHLEDDGQTVRYTNSFLHKELIRYIHPATVGYTTMFAQEPFMFGSNFVYSIEETTSIIQYMVETLTTAPQDSQLYPIMEAYVSSLFYTMVKGSTSIDIFNEQGIVREEFQAAWKRLASIEELTPLMYTLQPIIKEMEQTNWRSSAYWTKLQYNNLQEAIVLERDGLLEQFLP